MPKDFFTYKPDSRPWLIAGMGPTFSQRDKFDLSGYNILGINRIPTKMKVQVCQIIDFYILQKYHDEIVANSEYVAIPYYPHFYCRAFPEINVDHLLITFPFLKKLDDEGRLLCFNLSTIFPLRVGESPWIKARYFSAEASFNLLAHLGVKQIRTLGIDGGKIRSDEFKDHCAPDSRGFDLQWDNINKTVANFNINYEPLVKYEPTSETICLG